MTISRLLPIRPALISVGRAVFFTLLAVRIPTAGAADRAGGDLGKAEGAKAPAVSAAASPRDSAASNTIIQVLTRNYFISPGTSVYFDCPSDLTGVRRVGISVTTVSDPRSQLTDIRITVAFATPGDYYVFTDVIFGNSFYYFDHGAATVPVYGPLMRVVVSNDGSTPVRITQLGVYAVAH